MSKYVFKKNEAGIRKLLQSKECLNAMEGFVKNIGNVEEERPFIGFDRAKVFVKTDKETAERYKK